MSKGKLGSLSNSILKTAFMVLGWLFLSGSSASGPALPSPTGFVTDVAGVLTREQRQELETISKGLERNTSIELAVVTIPSLKGETLERYATALFNQWGVGKKEKYNGVMMLLAVNERKVRIETGLGMETLLPDVTCKDILNQWMVPYFKRGDLATGLLKGAQQVSHHLLHQALSLTSSASQGIFGIQWAASSTLLTVSQIQLPSPAADAHFQQGDVILTVQGRAVSTPQEFAKAVLALAPGTSIVIGISRSKQLLDLRLNIPLRQGPFPSQ